MTHSILRTRLRAIRRALHREDGIESVPGATIIMIGLMLFFFTALQVAFWYVGQNIAQVTANTAYQQARSYQATNEDGIAAGQQIIAAHAGELNQSQVDVTRTADTVTVTVTGRPASILPGLLLPPITKTLTGPIEQWIPGP